MPFYVVSVSNLWGLSAKMQRLIGGFLRNAKVIGGFSATLKVIGVYCKTLKVLGVYCNLPFKQCATLAQLELHNTTH